MKKFTKEDVRGLGTDYPRIYADYHNELIVAQPSWMKMGLQQTASGYGNRLNTGLKIHFEGRLYRLYATCHSNVASVWFISRGRKFYVN